MYNLFVTTKAGQWKKNICEYLSDRVINKVEYTDPSVARLFSPLSQNAFDQLMKYPCLFMYETGFGRGARIGKLTGIRVREPNIRIGYKIESSIKTIPTSKIFKLKLELDIEEYELSRTHWALKDIDLLAILKTAGCISEDDINKFNGDLIGGSHKEVLNSLGTSDINAFLEKSLQRITDDPEGAITSSRSLLETVCKQILDKLVISYDEKSDLPSLYKKVALNLNLAPSTETTEPIRRILGGGFNIVEGLGTLRNKMGDAHGRGLETIRPDIKHARLTVNLAATISAYLLETYESLKAFKISL